MHLTNQVVPDPSNLEDFIQNYPSGIPIVLVNIVKFKDYSEAAKLSNVEAFAGYGRELGPLLEKIGGHLLWALKVNKTLVGDLEDQPDQMLIVECPSKEALIKMTESEEYKKIKQVKEDAFQYTSLMVTESL